MKSIKELPEVQSVLVIGGSSPTGTLELRRAALTINLSRKCERTRSQGQLEPIIADKLAAIPDVRSFYVNDRGERELSVGILGSDGDKVADVASRLESPDAARSDVLQPVGDGLLPAAGDPHPAASRPGRRSRRDAGPDLADRPRRDDRRCRREPCQVQCRGAAGADPGRAEESARKDLSTIKNLRVTTASGASVPLDLVADIRFGQGPSTINRYDRERLVKVGSSMMPGYEIGQGLEKIR